MTTYELRFLLDFSFFFYFFVSFFIVFISAVSSLCCPFREPTVTSNLQTGQAFDFSIHDAIQTSWKKWALQGKITTIISSVACLLDED